MKLIILLGVEACEKDLRKIFHQNDVDIYSEFPIQGHKQFGTLPDPTNWFGKRDDTTYSTMAFSFVTEEKAQAVLASVAAYNQDNPSAYPLHAFRLAVEAAV